MNEIVITMETKTSTPWFSSMYLAQVNLCEINGIYRLKEYMIIYMYNIIYIWGPDEDRNPENSITSDTNLISNVIIVLPVLSWNDY